MSYLEKVKQEYGHIIESNKHLKIAVLALHVFKDIMRLPESLTEVGELRKQVEKYLKEIAQPQY